MRWGKCCAGCSRPSMRHLRRQHHRPGWGEQMILNGVRVVDRTTEIAGPYCTKLLADAGAEVVRVEPPGGDPLRRHLSGGLFEFLNQSKRSMSVDDRDLVERADVLVANQAV